METDEGWLDEMQAMLSNVCKAQNWDLKQTATLAGGTRSFNVQRGSKIVTVLISSLISTRIPADVIMEHDNIDYDEEQILTRLSRKFQ
jgi:hypothetical protein